LTYLVGTYHVWHPVGRVVFRNDKRRSSTPGGAWLSYAVSARLPDTTLWHNGRVLAQGRDGETDLRDPPMEAGGLLHAARQRIHRLCRASQIDDSWTNIEGRTASKHRNSLW